MSEPGGSWRFRPAAHPLIEPVPAFQDNYLWLIRAAGPTHGRRNAAIVDPGDPGPVEQALDQEGLNLTAIVLTHHHRDHTGGVLRLKERGATVYGPAHEDIGGIDHRLSDGDQVTLDGLDHRFTVIDVPGHTRGHIAYFCTRLGDDERPVLFCGDTLFAGGCGRLFEGTPAQMRHSLGRLGRLPADTLVFCAHEYTLSNLRFAEAVEPEARLVRERLAEAQHLRDLGIETVPSSIGIEQATNPFMRTAEPSVRSAARQRLGHPPRDDDEVFAAIRDWKNVFR